MIPPLPGLQFTTPRLDWVDNEVVTKEDFNRIEANAQAACKPQYASAFYNSGAYTMGSTLGAFFALSPNGVAHTSYTGRVKITCLVQLLNPDAGSRTPSLTLCRNGIMLTRNKPDGLAKPIIPAGEYFPVLMIYIAGDAPIGEEVAYSMALKQATGNITLATEFLLVEDV